MERSLLRELLKISANPKKMATVYKRNCLIFALLWLVCTLGTPRFHFPDASTLDLSFLGGIGIGLSLLYGFSAWQLPYLLKYCPPKVAEIEARLAELES
jgi:hypothetical protein